MITNAFIGTRGRALLIQDTHDELQIALGSENYPLVADYFTAEDVAQIIRLLSDWEARQEKK